MRDGFRWSPDGSRIAYWQFDTTGVGNFTLINNTDALYPVADADSVSQGRHHQLRRADRRRRPPTAATTTWMKTPGDPRDTYLARIEWVDADDAGDPAAEPPAEPATTSCWPMRADRRRARACFATSRRRGSTSSTRCAWIDDGTRVPVAERARRLAARLPRAARRAASRRCVTQLRRRRRCDVVGRRRTRRVALLHRVAGRTPTAALPVSRRSSTAPARRERVTPADAARHAQLRLAPGGRLAFHTYSRFDRRR